MMIQSTIISIAIWATLAPGKKVYGSTFCDTAAGVMAHSGAQLEKKQALKISNILLDQLKKGDANQYVPLSENIYVGLDSFFPEAKLRAGRTFFINAWDLNRLLEMQSKIDLVVIGKLSSEQISKVKKALTGTGIRIFFLTFEENLPMKDLSEKSGGRQIILPTSCD